MWHLLVLVLLLLTGPAQADERLTTAELAALLQDVEAIHGASGDYAESEALAGQLYGLVLRDFGEESREALEVERVIVAIAMSQSQGDRATQLAQQMMEKALRLLPATDPLGYRCAAVYGGALRLVGQTETSLGFLSETLAEADKNLAADDQAIVEVLLSQAISAQAAGRPDVADAAYQRTDALLAGRSDPLGQALHAVALQGYARLLAEYGDDDAAAEAFKAALAALDRQFAALPRPRMMPLRLDVESQLAELLLRLGRRDEASDLVSADMAEVVEVYGADSPIWADLAFIRAVALVGDAPGGPGDGEALALLEKVVAIQEAAYDPLTVVLQRSRMSYAVLLAAMGQDEKALDQLERLEGGTEAAERSQVVFVLHSLMKSGHISRERAVEAVLIWLQESQTEGAAAAQRILSARIEAGGSAEAALLRERTDIQGRLSATRSDLATVMSRPADQRDPALVQALRDEVDRLGDATTALRDRIAREAPRLAEALLPKPLDLAEIRRRLGPDAALVVIDPPRHSRDSGLVVAVSAEAVDWHSFQVEGPQIESAIATLRRGIDLRLGVRAAAALDGAPATQAAFDLETAHWLYLQTFGQLEAVLKGKPLIYADLRGAVSALPPQLLVTAPPQSPDFAQADWLVRDHALAILPALAALPQPGNAPPAPKTALLAFADPDFASPDFASPDFASPGAEAYAALRGSLAPLPETEAEVRDVALAFGAGEAALRLGNRASEAALKGALLDGIGTLYFATHGLVSGDEVGAGQVLEEPALALTAGEGEDGFLTASEIAELHLNAGLVVLSACNTARGDRPGADSLSGLAQSFLYAGARGLMVSHWPVESRSAVSLMTGLFRHHAVAGDQPLAYAQQTAILAMIDAPENPAWSHPAYWAPFVIVGNPD